MSLWSQAWHADASSRLFQGHDRSVCDIGWGFGKFPGGEISEPKLEARWSKASEEWQSKEQKQVTEHDLHRKPTARVWYHLPVKCAAGRHSKDIYLWKKYSNNSGKLYLRYLEGSARFVYITTSSSLESRCLAVSLDYFVFSQTTGWHHRSLKCL